MAVTITVEDGNGVVTANSWVTLAEAQDYAAQRGVVVPAGDPGAVMVIKAADFINSFRGRFRGTQTFAGLPMVWPRTDACIEGNDLDAQGAGSIPALLKAAQFEAVLAVQAGVILMPNHVGGDLPVIREKVGPLDTEYANPFEASGGYINWRSPKVPGVMAALKPLMRTVSGLRTERI